MQTYAEQYGTEPNSNTMIAGFQYLKKSRSGSYRVLGRIHLFEVSDLGLYCNSMVEQETFNALHKIAQESKDTKFWIPPEDASIGAFIQVKGYDKKLLLLFRGAKTQRVAFDPAAYVPLLVEEGMELTEKMFREVIAQ